MTDCGLCRAHRSRFAAGGGAWAKARIALDAKRTVAALRANNGNASRCPRIDATLDLGGLTLTVLGDYSAESLWSTSSRFSRVTVTNGTFKADAVKIGAINNLIFREPNIVAQDAAFRCGSGSLTMEGPGTTVAIRKGVDLIGPFTRLRVAGGANFTCDRLLEVLDGSVFRGAATTRLEDGGTRLVYNGLSGRTMVIVR